MKFQVKHKTIYKYKELVSLCHNECRLTPKPIPGQNCFNHQLIIDPTPAVQTSRVDFFGNEVCYFSVQAPHKELTVTAISEMERVLLQDYANQPPQSQPWEEVVTYLNSTADEALDAKQFVFDSPLVRRSSDLRGYAEISFSPSRPIFEAASDLMYRIFTEFEFVAGFTDVTTPILEAFHQRKGVCQDFAQIAIGCIRSMGLAARYVSGYIETLPPPGQTKLQGSDASHAWFSIFIPQLGWIDFDPTNNQIPGEQHIVTAWGRDYADVPPLKGVIMGSGSHELTYAVDVTRL